VNGTLNAYTQIGDPISVEVITVPTQGTVTLTDDGRFFTYSPHEALAGTPGNDKFTVKVTDEGFHLGSLLGAKGHSTTADVSVSWQDLTPPPPGDNGFYAFNIWNYTGYDLRVSSESTQSATQWPVVNTIVPQNTYTFVQMEDCYCNKDKVSTFYFENDVAGLAGVPSPDTISQDFKANTKVVVNANYGGVTAVVSCATNGTSICHASSDGHNIYFYDAVGTTFTLPGNTAEDIDVQNNVINGLVNDQDSPNNVGFTSETDYFGYTPLLKVAGVEAVYCPPTASCTVANSSTSSVSNSAGNSQTVGVQVEVGTPKTYWINFQVSASYQETWDKSVTLQTSDTFALDIQLTAEAPLVTNGGYQMYAFQATPVAYTGGTTTVYWQNDTYYLEDTWYSFPAYPDGTETQTFWFPCPAGGNACQQMFEGYVPAGTNGMLDPNDPNDPGYQECVTDCALSYGTASPGQPVKTDTRGYTLLPLLYGYPTYYLTDPVGSSVPLSTQG
jgi:hypothetical protein